MSQVLEPLAAEPVVEHLTHADIKRLRAHADKHQVAQDFVGILPKTLYDRAIRENALGPHTVLERDGKAVVFAFKTVDEAPPAL
jgi:DNA-binding FadR family transcriptional regulator